MVRGLHTFKKYFEPFPHNYVIIGGTACDMILSDAGLTPRATKDIDIILVVEALSKSFGKEFWKFIKDGKYEYQEKSEEERKYYRFMKPEEKEFPFQIELFSRTPGLIELDDTAHLTPIPIDDDLSSLSAILLNNDYYDFIIKHSRVENGLHRANTEALLCLKAKAFLEIRDRIANGSKEDSKQLNKHRNDIFRMAVMLAENDVFELPETIKTHLQNFIDIVTKDLPDKAIFKEMGLGNLNVKLVYPQLRKSFGLN